MSRRTKINHGPYSVRVNSRGIVELWNRSYRPFDFVPTSTIDDAVSFLKQKRGSVKMLHFRYLSHDALRTQTGIRIGCQIIKERVLRNIHRRSLAARRQRKRTKV